MERAWEKYRKPRVFLKDLAGLACLISFILVLTYRTEYEFKQPCGSPNNISVAELTVRFPFNKHSYEVEFGECKEEKSPTAAPQNATTAAPTTAPVTTPAPTTATNNIARKRRSSGSNQDDRDYSSVFARQAAIYDSESALAFAILVFLGAIWALIAFIYYCATDCRKSCFHGLDLFLTLILAALITIASALFTAVIGHLSNENFVKNALAKCKTDAGADCDLTSSGSFLQLEFGLAFGYLSAILFFINLFCLVVCNDDSESYSNLGGQQQQQQENIPVQDKKTTYDAV